MVSFARIVVALILGIHGVDSISRELLPDPGARLELLLEQKIKRSFDEAPFVLVGKFKLPKDIPELDVHAKEEAFLLVEFQVERIIKGAAQIEHVIKGAQQIRGKTINLEIPIFFRGQQAVPSLKVGQQELDLAKGENRRLEFESAATKSDRQAYDAAMLKVRNTLLQSDKYLRDFVLAPIRVGGLDVTYRRASVLVTFGDSYVLFLFRKEFYPKDVTPFFPWELDIYPSSDKRVMQVLDQH